MVERFSDKQPGYVVLGLAAVLLALGGCGSDSASAGSTGSMEGDGKPLYAFESVVYTPDFSSSSEYIRFSTSLKAGTKIDESKSIELQSQNATLWALQGTGEFFLTEPETGQVVKYLAGNDGSIKETGRLSFAAYGVSSFLLPEIPIVSSTKAYLFDELTLQGFVWNPSSMTITSNVDLSAKFDNKEGGKTFQVWRERGVLSVGKKFVAAFNYWDLQAYDSLSRSGMVVIDSETDTFTVVKNAGCGGLHNSVLGPDGYVYSASGLHYAAAHYAGSPNATTPPCMVRFDLGKGAFDDTFKVDLNALTGGKPTGALVENTGSSAYLRVLNEALLPPQVPKTAGLAISTTRAWETYRIEDVTAPATPKLVKTPASAFPMLVMRMDDHAYISDTDFSINQSTILDMTTDPPTPGIAIKGWMTYALRVK